MNKLENEILDRATALLRMTDSPEQFWSAVHGDYLLAAMFQCANVQQTDWWTRWLLDGVFARLHDAGDWTHDIAVQRFGVEP